MIIVHWVHSPLPSYLRDPTTCAKGCASTTTADNDDDGSGCDDDGDGITDDDCADDGDCEGTDDAADVDVGIIGIDEGIEDEDDVGCWLGGLAGGLIGCVDGGCDGCVSSAWADCVGGNCGCCGCGSDNCCVTVTLTVLSTDAINDGWATGILL